ncbi:MAG TPA: sulfatase [Candidatus Brocadiia bacterium]|nr:sulfatase [Candidatus Brocadiia bacterium]
MTQPLRPNVLIVLTDQWRAQALGRAGDVNARTPNLDAFAGQATVFETAVANCPVCTPARASLLTGQHAHTHGLFMNDLCLGNQAETLAQVFGRAGYDTGYIGKWHLDGHGRSSPIPPERRQGFQFWKATECNHNYNAGFYHDDNGAKIPWEGYEPESQTREAQRYLAERDRASPFFFVLSWGPPHTPYQTAPERFREMFDPSRLALRPNVPAGAADDTRPKLAGYYAHCAALDACFGGLMSTIKDLRLWDNTIILFTSDHGDMVGSWGQFNKQRPYDESILVPFMMRLPPRLGIAPTRVQAPLGMVDIMPTLLGLCGLAIPPTVQGVDFTPVLRGQAPAPAAALIACYMPFGQWSRAQGGREYRGVRTARHTYVRDLNGPWLLFDNLLDPYQTRNLAGNPAHAHTERHLDDVLRRTLHEIGDTLEPGQEMVKRWGYALDKDGKIGYTE